jgi:hypothetical protein
MRLLRLEYQFNLDEDLVTTDFELVDCVLQELKGIKSNIGKLYCVS